MIKNEQLPFIPLLEIVALILALFPSNLFLKSVLFFFTYMRDHYACTKLYYAVIQSKVFKRAVSLAEAP